MLITLLKFARPHAWPLSLSLLCRVLNQLGTIAMLVVAGQYTQQLFANTQPELFAQLVWPLLWIGGSKAFCRYVEQLSGHNAAFRIQEDFRNRVYWSLEQQAPENISQLSSGELTSRVVADIERVEVFYAHTIIPVLSAFVVSCSLIILTWCWYGFDFAVGLAILLVITGGAIPFLHIRRSLVSGHGLRHQFGKLNATLTDIVNGISEIQNWAAIDYFQQKVQQQGVLLQKHHRELAVRNGIKDATTDLTISLGFIIIVFIACRQTTAVSSQWLALLCLYAGAFGPVLALTRTFEDLAQTFPSCRRVLALISIPQVKAETTEVTRAIQAQESALLEISVANYGHQLSAPLIIQSCQWKLKLGEYHLLQGESGSGKTSLLQLLGGAHLSAQAEVYYQGNRVDENIREQLWCDITYVPQQAVILPASLRHNLCLDKIMSDEELRDVLKLMSLDSWLDNLPQGLDTELGLYGARVSGGEGQRIALARALLRDTKIYLLDEAYGALDQETEMVVRQALQYFWQNKLVVEVSHQPQGFPVNTQHWYLGNGELHRLNK
ncbi:ATP-binding cassette domain-containing protein [Vibrio mimicus]|uniref:amino acid ABC transporter ATP-binding/permease protein n=1 Tax=Vibrio mimicus TaxID=674 RepID=UPI002F95363D